MISARVAQADDADRANIALIESAMADEIRDQRGGAVHLAELAIRHAPDISFVGCIDDVVLGFAHVRIVRHTPEHTVGEILSYGVVAEARGVGVGEAMLNLVVEYCRENGCTGIDAHALPGARETKNFFETFGFTARRLVVHHSLR
jgi:ribosomal protein S18 acetylase RimI-like enzyme